MDGRSDDIGQWVGFGLRSLARHAPSAALLFAAIVGISVLAAIFLPRTWLIHSRIFAAPPESAPGAARPSGGGALSLTPAAVDAALSRKWLEQTAQNLSLGERLAQRPSWTRDVRARVSEVLGRPAATPAERDQAALELLADRFTVKQEQDAVALELKWPDRAMALEILRLAEAELLRVREQAELEPLARRKAALDDAIAANEARIAQTLALIERTRETRRKGARPSTVRGLQAEGAWGALPDVRLVELRRKLMELRAALTRREQAHQKRAAELRAVAAEQRALFTAAHPTLMETEERLAANAAEGLEIEKARAQEHALLAEYVKLGGRDGELAAVEGAPLWPEELTREDEALTLARAQVGKEVDQLAALLATRDEVATSLAAERAAFPERYVLIQPARVERSPVFPKVPLLIAAGVLGGLLVALFASVLRDLLGDRLVEPGQLERTTGLKLLGEVQRG